MDSTADWGLFGETDINCCETRFDKGNFKITNDKKNWVVRMKNNVEATETGAYIVISTGALSFFNVVRMVLDRPPWVTVIS